MKLNIKYTIYVLAILICSVLGAQEIQAAEPTALELLSNKVGELDGTKWAIEVKLRDGKGEPESDVIRFDGNTLIVQSLEEEGFPATNYTPTIGRNNDVFILQTMKQNDKGETVFVRSEIEHDTISGIISRQSKKGTRKTFTFKGSVMEMAAAVPPAVTTPPEPAVVPAAEMVEPILPKAAVVKPSPPPTAAKAAPPAIKAPAAAVQPAKAAPKKQPWWKRIGKGK